jgi:hypothetical protein
MAEIGSTYIPIETPYDGAPAAMPLYRVTVAFNDGQRVSDWVEATSAAHATFVAFSLSSALLGSHIAADVADVTAVVETN